MYFCHQKLKTLILYYMDNPEYWNWFKSSKETLERFNIVS